VVKNVKKGEPFTAENVRSIRPAMGLSTKRYEEALAKKAFCDIEAGTPLSEEMIAGE
jgi:sialic acid synthase SpsE